MVFLSLFIVIFACPVQWTMLSCICLAFPLPMAAAYFTPYLESKHHRFVEKREKICKRLHVEIITAQAKNYVQHIILCYRI